MFLGKNDIFLLSHNTIVHLQIRDNLFMLSTLNQNYLSQCPEGRIHPVPIPAPSGGPDKQINGMVMRDEMNTWVDGCG